MSHQTLFNTSKILQQFVLTSFGGLIPEARFDFPTPKSSNNSQLLYVKF